MNKSKNKTSKIRLVNFRSDCRVCGNRKIRRIFNLGTMPLAGNFVKKKDIKKKEVKVPLTLYFCENCQLVQVKDSINPKVLFSQYNYSSSVIPSLNDHFVDYAKKIIKKFKKKKIRLLEFGCNDGVLLKEFNKYKNFFCLGVDPSNNISNLAKENGVKIINKYFNKTTANKILKKYQKFDYITGSNVFAHIDDIHSVVEASKILLKDNGSLVIEVHYLLDLINLNQYDFFYHEHLNYYTINSLKHLFKKYNLSIKKIERISVHGGSIRVTVQNISINKKETSKELQRILKSEKKVNFEYFKKFEKNIFKQKKKYNKYFR